MARSSIAIEDLKRRVSALEQRIGPADRTGFGTGCAEIDGVLPARSFATGALHELQCDSYQDRAAVLGATLALSARLLSQHPGPLLWCQERDPDRLHLHAPGLTAFGVDPARLTKITLHSEADLLWAIEEALDCDFVAGVVGVLWSEKLYNFKASRRLALRAKESGVTALMVRSHRTSGATAAETRWRISSLESQTHRQQRSVLPAMGSAQWRLDMVKCRGAKPDAVTAVWDHEEVRFNLATRLADRADRPPRPSAVSLRKAV